MKRFVSISLSLLFLAGTMGFAVATHYCHGFAVRTSLVLHGDLEPCADGKMPMEGCCENDVDYFKVHDDYLSAQGKTLQILSTSCPLPCPAPVAALTPARQPDYRHYKPPLYRSDLSVLFRSLLI